ncbi:MAG: AmpG family muropeptide MFS transporter [Magnetococcales bacterium]|nr:AmpG family muropeptide MFS transporter [Magnetococcales bacterium]
MNLGFSNPLKSIEEFLHIYGHPRIVAVLALGFSSGLPLALTFGTLSLWLAESGVSKTSIGLFTLSGIPYTFKFLWAPLVDRMPLPWLTLTLGRRRGWAILTQFFLMLSIAAMGFTHPAELPLWTAVFALITAFWSATQDIVIDAYRVEILDEDQYGAGAAVVVLGYRLGMLTSGALALYLATWVGWMATYLIMASLMLVGMITILLTPEPKIVASGASIKLEKRMRAKISGIHGLGEGGRKLVLWLSGAVVGPFAEFLSRKGWFQVLLFILLYKLGDALTGVMGNPFYSELGFTRIEIAEISKVVGLTATIVGAFFGGWVVKRLGIMKALFLCGILQLLSNLTFVILARAGHDMKIFAATVLIEHLAGGMGTAAFVAYLSSLCDIAYTATQYALLSSFMAFGRTVLSSAGGWMADHMTWEWYFFSTSLSGLPALLLLVWMMKRFPPGGREQAVGEPDLP